MIVRFRNLCLMAAAACAVLLAADCHAFLISMSPPKIEIISKPGQTHKSQIKFINNGEETLTMKAYTEDWVYDATGDKQFKPAGTTPFSCAGWVHVKPDSFVLKPKESVVVECIIDTPADAAGSHVAVAFFETSIGDLQNQSVTVSYGARIGCVIYQRTEGSTTIKADVKEIQVSAPDDNKPLKFTVAMENTGNSYIRGKGDISIIDSTGGLFGKTTFSEANSLPGDTVSTTSEWNGGLPEGEYDIIATIDIEAQEPIVLEKTISVKNNVEIESVDLADEGNGTVCNVTVSNSGNITFGAEGTLVVCDKGGAALYETGFQINSCYPSEKETAKINLSGIPPEAAYIEARIPFKDTVLKKRYDITM